MVMWKVLGIKGGNSWHYNYQFTSTVYAGIQNNLLTLKNTPQNTLGIKCEPLIL